MIALRTVFVAFSLALAAFALAPSAAAGDPVIDSAIASGEVGERIDGYLGVVSNADATTTRKVQDINNRRRAVYEQTASENGTTVQIVAQLAGEKQIAKLQSGQFYMDASGTWQRK